MRLSSQDRRAGGVTFDGREDDDSFAMLVAPTSAETVHQASHRCRPIGPRAAVEQHIRAFQQTNQVAMIAIALHRTSSHSLACLDVRQEKAGRYQPGMAGESREISAGDGKIKRDSSLPELRS